MRRDYKAARVNLMGAYFKLPTRITSKYLNESLPIPEKQYCALGSSIREIQQSDSSSRWSEKFEFRPGPPYERHERTRDVPSPFDSN